MGVTSLKDHLCLKLVVKLENNIFSYNAFNLIEVYI